MSEFIEVTEDVTIIETDDDHVEVIEAGVPGPQGPQGDPATNLVTSVAGGTGDVTLEDMGLDLVDNTSDLDKPVSTAQQAALDAKAAKLSISQFTVPVRSLAGSGEVDASRPWTSAATGATFAYRGAGGVLGVGTAVSATDAVPKAQMDALVPIYGTGFPNGVVAATPGRIYIDTAGTNGASSWIKKSGTGNTGWSVLEGDTGWRNLGQIWPSISNNIWIRRIGSECYITSNGDAMVTVSTVVNYSYFTPSGFAPTGRSEILIADNGTIRGRVLAKQTESALFLTINTLSSVNAFVNNSYLTGSTWPTTLPGTAV